MSGTMCGWASCAAMTERNLAPRLCYTTPAAQREQQEQRTDGDAHVGDVERPEPDVANTHVDEVDDAGAGSQAIEQITERAPRYQRHAYHAQALGREGPAIQKCKDAEGRDGQEGEDESTFVAAELNAHRGIRVVRQRESHDVSHQRMRLADGKTTLDEALAGAVGDQQCERKRPEPARFPHHATPNTRSRRIVRNVPRASTPKVTTTIPLITKATKDRSARIARAGSIKWRSSSATFRRLAFHAKSKISPRIGTAPSPASSAILPAIRTRVARDAPRRIAATRIHPARTAPTASPTPGISPISGSSPNRNCVPGIRIPESSSSANRQSVASLRDDVSAEPLGHHVGQRGHDEPAEEAVLLVEGAGREEEHVTRPRGRTVAESDGPETIDRDRPTVGCVELTTLLQLAVPARPVEIERVDVPVAEVPHEQVAAELPEVCGGDGEPPGRIQPPLGRHTAQQVPGHIERVHEPMALAGDVIVLVGILERVGHVDDAAQAANPERRVSCGERGVGEPARHGIEGGVEHVHGARVEVAGVETVAGSRAGNGQTLIDGTAGRVVHGDDRACRGDPRIPSQDRAVLGGEDEARGTVRRATRDDKPGAAVEDGAGGNAMVRLGFIMGGLPV